MSQEEVKVQASKRLLSRAVRCGRASWYMGRASVSCEGLSGSCHNQENLALRISKIVPKVDLRNIQLLAGVGVHACEPTVVGAGVEGDSLRPAQVTYHAPFLKNTYNKKQKQVQKKHSGLCKICKVWKTVTRNLYALLNLSKTFQRL